MLQRTYATVNDPTTKEYYNEQFLSIKPRCYNERDRILSADAARACVHDVSAFPALIRASVIIFVMVCKVQLSVKFSYMLIYTVYKS
jgi:hypothetical protein